MSDLDAGELRVTQNVHRVRNDEVSTHAGGVVRGFRFGPAKTHRAKRRLSMPPFLVTLLRAWRAEQAAARLKAGRAWTDLDLVFTDALGYPHDPNPVRRTSRRASTRRGQACGALRTASLRGLRGPEPHRLAPAKTDNPELETLAERVGFEPTIELPL